MDVVLEGLNSLPFEDAGDECKRQCKIPRLTFWRSGFLGLQFRNLFISIK